MKSAEAITAHILLLVEGDDEALLVKQMCEHWFLPEQVRNIDIENVKGRDNFPKRFKALEFRSLGELKVVGVIADSEENPAATVQRWTDLFADVVPKIKRPCKKLQLPNDTTSGAFETLVLNALADNPLARCALNFRDCVSPLLEKRTQAQRDKIAVQAWLSAQLGSAYGNVFKAQEKNPAIQLLDYDHLAFAPIKTFIEELLASVSIH